MGRGWEIVVFRVRMRSIKAMAISPVLLRWRGDRILRNSEGVKELPNRLGFSIPFIRGDGGQHIKSVFDQDKTIINERVATRMPLNIESRVSLNFQLLLACHYSLEFL